MVNQAQAAASLACAVIQKNPIGADPFGLKECLNGGTVLNPVAEVRVFSWTLGRLKGGRPCGAAAQEQKQCNRSDHGTTKVTPPE